VRLISRRKRRDTKELAPLWGWAGPRREDFSEDSGEKSLVGRRMGHC
jgi:hypothetical protein